MEDDKIVKIAKELLVGEEIVIAIVGSRSFDSFEHFKAMDEFIWEKVGSIDRITGVVSGGAYGADSLGKAWAETYKIHCTEFLPDWKMYRKAAGMIRNESIVKAADVVFAFWDGKSKGTRSSMKLAKQYGKVLYIYTF